MKKFIHTEFIEENAVNVSELPESLQKKLEKFTETQALLEDMIKGPEKNKRENKLRLLSKELLDEIEDELYQPEVETKGEEIPDETKGEEIPDESKGEVKPVEKKEEKPSSGSGWFLGIALLGLVAAVVGVQINNGAKK